MSRTLGGKGVNRIDTRIRLRCPSPRLRCSSPWLPCGVRLPYLERVDCRQGVRYVLVELDEFPLELLVVGHIDPFAGRGTTSPSSTSKAHPAALRAHRTRSHARCSCSTRFS